MNRSFFAQIIFLLLSFRVFIFYTIFSFLYFINPLYSQDFLTLTTFEDIHKVWENSPWFFSISQEHSFQEDFNHVTNDFHVSGTPILRILPHPQDYEYWLSEQDPNWLTNERKLLNLIEERKWPLINIILPALPVGKRWQNSKFEAFLKTQVGTLFVKMKRFFSTKDGEGALHNTPTQIKASKWGIAKHMLLTPGMYFLAGKEADIGLFIFALLSTLKSYIYDVNYKRLVDWYLSPFKMTPQWFQKLKGDYYLKKIFYRIFSTLYTKMISGGHGFWTSQFWSSLIYNNLDMLSGTPMENYRDNQFKKGLIPFSWIVRMNVFNSYWGGALGTYDNATHSQPLPGIGLRAYWIFHIYNGLSLLSWAAISHFHRWKWNLNNPQSLEEHSRKIQSLFEQLQKKRLDHNVESFFQETWKQDILFYLGQSLHSQKEMDQLLNKDFPQMIKDIDLYTEFLKIHHGSLKANFFLRKVKKISQQQHWKDIQIQFQEKYSTDFHQLLDLLETSIEWKKAYNRLLAHFQLEWQLSQHQKWNTEIAELHQLKIDFKNMIFREMSNRREHLKKGDLKKSWRSSESLEKIQNKLNTYFERLLENHNTDYHFLALPHLKKTQDITIFQKVYCPL